MSTKATLSEPKDQRRGNKFVSREEWVAARKELLKSEKELTRRSDELAQQRHHPKRHRRGNGSVAIRSHAAHRVGGCGCRAGEGRR